MKYQTVKHLKTKSKTIAISDTFAQALAMIPAPATFRELSYMGGFPVFTDGKHSYSIQGKSDAYGVVCSLPSSDTEAYKSKK